MTRSRLMLVSAIVPVLSACATQAQMKFSAMRSSEKEAMQQYVQCAGAVYNSPATALLRSHVPPNPNKATLQQLSDGSFATPDEIQAILVVHPQLKLCFQVFADSLRQSEPVLAPVFAKWYAKLEENLVELAQGKITWGEYTRRGPPITAERDAAVGAADQNVVSELNIENQQEINARIQAIHDLSQGLDALSEGLGAVAAIQGAMRPSGPTITHL
jgi:hypothetical protein